MSQPECSAPVGEPWEVVAPTTLVYLQEDAELTRWSGNGMSASTIVVALNAQLLRRVDLRPSRRAARSPQAA